MYGSLYIKNQLDEYTASVNLILDEHPSETLSATVEDDRSDEVDDASVTWSSSDSSIATVNNGVITAVSAGTATITAEVAGVSDTCEVSVYSAPVFTDFSNAKYETELNGNTESLKISGITPDEDNSKYYYVITSTNSKPDLTLDSYGGLESSYERLSVNTEKNYLYTYTLENYTEYNQDLYLWVIQEKDLDYYYSDEDGNYIQNSTRFVVEGEEISRADLPQLNLILQTFDIGGYANDENGEGYTHIKFNFPSNTENRKFTIKIGKVTDTSILSKIQNNDYTGITELLSYAKNNSSVYTQELTTTGVGYYRSDDALFDGNKLLEDDAYYYIYVQFDDEDGTYVPVEGVTLAQAWLSSYNDSWDLYVYTSDDFDWSNFGDTTVATGTLPQTGTNVTIILTAIAIVSLISVICYKKYHNLKDID